MKRPYKLENVLVDLKEVAVVDEPVTLRGGTQIGFALVLRSGHEVYAREHNTSAGNNRIVERRNEIIKLLE